MHYDGCMDRLDKHVFGAGPLLKLPMLLVGRLYGATSAMDQPETPKPETFINNANLELTAKHGGVHFSILNFFFYILVLVALKSHSFSFFFQKAFS